VTNAFRVARRELRGGLKGFRVVLACIALGVAAIAAVGSIASSMITGLEEDGAILLGGDAALRMTHRDISTRERAYLEKSAEVSRVVYLRSMARSYKTGKRSLVEMKMVDNAYPLFGALETSAGDSGQDLFSKRGTVWGAVADTALLKRLGIDVGGQITIGDATYEVRGTIDREPDRISGARALQLGPRFIASAASVGDSGLIQPGSQVWYFYRIRLNDRAALSTWKSELEKTFPDAQWVLRDRGNASPVIKDFIDRTTLFMTLVGLTALLIGGVGVSNAVRDFLAGKMQTIATLKCIGASSGLIFGVYLIQILTMSLIGIAIGLLIGGLAPAVLADLLRETLPLVARVGLYTQPLLLATAFGILTALAFSIWPIAQACDLPAAGLFRDSIARFRGVPRWQFVMATVSLLTVLIVLVIETASSRVIAMYFVGGSTAAIALFAIAGFMISRAAKMATGMGGTGLRLALANLHRPGAPTGSVVMSLGLGLTVLVTVALIEFNLGSQITKSMPQRAPGFFFIDIQNDQVSAFEKTVSGVAGFREMRRTPMLRGRVTRLNGETIKPENVAENGRWILHGDRGVTWARELPEDETLVAGDWWPADYNGPQLVSLSARSAAALGLRIGDTITINILGRNITGKVANLRDVRWGTLRMNFLFMFSPGELAGAPQTHLATVHADPEGEEKIETAVAAAFPNVTTIRVRDVLEAVNGFLGKLGLAIQMTAGIAIIAGTLVLAGAVAAGHRRRVYDSVVLKVLGATRGRITGILLLEYGLLGLLTALIASVVGSIAAWAVVTEVMKLEFIFDPFSVITASFIAIAAVLVIGFYGIWRALGQKAGALLHNE